MKLYRKTHFLTGKFPLYTLICLTLILVSACANREESKKKYYERGMELFTQGNFTKARLEFKNVLQIDPKDANTYFMFGQIEEKEENWPKAYALFLRASELDSAHVGAQVHLGTIYALAGETEKALAAADAALKVEPKNAPAMVLKGFVKAKAGEKDAAIDNVLSAIESDPRNVEAASLLAALYADQGDLDRAIRIAKDSLTQHPDRAASYLLLARLYLQSGNSEEVVGVLSELIRINPDDLQNRLHLVSYYQKSGETEQAVNVLQKAVADLPDNIEAKLALVAFNKSQGKMERAGTLLEQYVRESPENTALKLELARHYLAGGRYDVAQKVLSEVIDLADQSREGLTAKTLKASILVKQQVLEEASSLLEEVLESDPKFKDALLIRAGLALMSDDPDKGIGDLRTLLREDPSFVKAHRLKARAHLKKGEIELARQSLEDAIKIQPDEAAANFELVQLLINTGEYDDAVVVLRKMRRFAPDNIKVLQGLALVHEKLEQWVQLTGIAAELMKSHPESPLGYYYRGISLLERDMASQSIADFEKALELKPDAIEALVAIAKGLFALKKPDDALQRIEKVIETDPKNYLAINLKGEVHLSQKQWDLAKIAFQQARTLRPEWSVPYRNLIKLSVLQGTRDNIMEVLAEGFEQTGDPVLGIDLANGYSQAGRNDDAMRTYEKILTKYPKHLLASNNLAMLLLKGEAGKQALDKALRLVEDFELSENPVILDTLGWVHCKRGEFDKAISVLERAARKGSGLPEIDYHLGLAYYRQGRMDSAKRHIRTSLTAEKPFDGIDEAKALLSKID
jgi:tetratricopeptide (TPR) repeat protein